MARRIDLLDRTLAERSLADFVRQAWIVLEPQTAFQTNWHIDLLAEYLEAVADGTITRLIVNVPPRSGKSLLATIFLPCWVWLRNPGERFMFASYSATLSTKHSVDRRTLIKSQWYQSRWSSVVKLADDSNLKSEFSNTARGHQIATSVGASATGRGGNFLLADDLINPDQANSDVERENALRWFDETYSTRLDDKRAGRIVVIEQRTHAADLTGHLLAQGGWTLVSLPAIAEQRTLITFPRSGREVIRDEGDVLWPAREGPAELEAAKVRLSSFGFAAQYQQSPVSREGYLFKAEWLAASYRAGALPTKFDSIVLSLDTAFKTGSSNDYSAIVILGTLRNAYSGYTPGHYMLDAWRGRVEFGELKRKVVALHETWRSHAVLVEDAGSGQSLIQELRAGTTLPVKPIKPDRDKYSRASAVCPVLEARRLILPEAAWWRDDFIAELTSFPAGTFDDWVDALVQALNYLRDSGGGASWVALAQLQAAASWVRVGGMSVDQAAAKAVLSTAELKNWIARASTISGPLRSGENPRTPTLSGRFRPLRPTAGDPNVREIFDAARKSVEAGEDVREVALKARIDAEQLRGYVAWVNAPIGPREPWDSLVEKLLAGRAAGSYLDINIDMYRGRIRNMLRVDGRPEAVALVAELDKRFRI